MENEIELTWYCRIILNDNLLQNCSDVAVIAFFLVLLGRAAVAGNGSILVMMTAELHPTSVSTSC